MYLPLDHKGGAVLMVQGVMIMSLIWQFLFCIVLAYFIGGINPAYLLGRLRGFDIRDSGSGNAGASNAVITMGKLTGLFCALFDIFKAYISVKIAIHLFPLLKIAGIIAGGSCILGHMFPVMMHFQGGKGLATLGGTVLSYDVKTFLMLLLLEILFVLVVDYICVVPISGSVIFILILTIDCGITHGLCFLPVVLAILYCHMENLYRIHYGIEARFSYLWKKQKELDRIQQNWEKLTKEQQERFKKGALA